MSGDSDPVPMTLTPALPEDIFCDPDHPTLTPALPEDIFCDPDHPTVVPFHDVLAAARLLEGDVVRTPCTKSRLSATYGMELYLKREYLQHTGSFKERGVRYTLLMLSQEKRDKGVIAASTGNHAVAMSYHGASLGIPVTVVMPTIAPAMKIETCRRYHANVVVHGADISESRKHALKLAKENDLLYVNGYDHPHIISGQGTVALEILEQVPNVEAILVPVGGGGLLAGTAAAVKRHHPDVAVIGVESGKCASFSAAMCEGKPTWTKADTSFADGLLVPTVGCNSFATAAPLIDRIVSVKEESIALAMIRVLETEKTVLEGAGATPLAAVVEGWLPELRGKTVAVILGGCNVDTRVLGRAIETGLVADEKAAVFSPTDGIASHSSRTH